MVKLIVGKKGSGKTKTLLKMVDEAAAASKGHVVCIEKGDSLRPNVKNHIRLINTKEYAINGAESYYGFIAGLLAGNYDITDVFGDATFKIICGKDVHNTEMVADFVEKVAGLLGERDVNIVFTVSCDSSELPERVAKYIG